MLLTNSIVLRSIFRGTQVPKVRVSFRADWKRRETETVVGERLRAMDKLHRQSTERIDAVTLRVQERPLGVREVIAGEKPHINYRNIPSVLYTWPEAAGVGITEEELISEERPYKSGSFPFRALGRARAAMETDGLVKILADPDTDEILGVHMMGARIADLIAEAVVALEYRASAEDLSRMSHAHPTFAEAVKEAALDATAKRPLHL